jgi:hypothetical protein
MESIEYLTRLAAFAEQMRPDAARLDHDSDCAEMWFNRLQQEGLNKGASSHLPLSSMEFCEALAIFGRVSGTFGFLFLQQLVANPHLQAEEAGLWQKVGIAYGHLRRIGGVCPVWSNGVVSGFVPWFSGAGVFEKVVLGMRDTEGQELFAIVSAEDRTEFSHSTPLDLFACSGTRTVTINIQNMPLPQEAVHITRPKGSQAEGDAKGVLFHTPLLVGCVEALWEQIAPCTHLSPHTLTNLQARKENLLGRIREGFTTGDFTQGNHLRAEIGDFAVRLGRLAMMARGGSTLLATHPAQRLFREAMIYNLMAQTDTIVQEAFDQVLA